jgi:carbamoyl-phosphate synthase/aspartate carbamoyltransferase/dihydroorotase
MSLVLIPGTMDPHVHLRGMEWAHKGDFATETAAALAGGYTAVLDMPNTPPSTTDLSGLERKLSELDQNARCDYGVWLGAHPSGARSREETMQLARQVCGIKLYCGHTTGGLTITPEQMDRQVASWPGPGVVAAHAEGEMVGLFLASVARWGKQGHLCHIDTAQAVSMVAEHKRRGTKVTAGVCPHHLFFTERDRAELGPRGVMKPPLGTSADRDALWKGLREGVIDVVESDHAPHTWEEKSGVPTPFGVPGLETTIPLMFTAVREGRISRGRAVEVVSSSPRAIFGLDPSPPETYTLVDTGASRVVGADGLYTQCGWTPFSGMEVRGVIRRVVIRGRVVFEDGQVLAPPGFGSDLYAVGS